MEETFGITTQPTTPTGSGTSEDMTTSSSSPMLPIDIRIPRDVVRRADEIARAISEREGVAVDRSAVLRGAITRGLALFDVPPSPPKAA